MIGPASDQERTSRDGKLVNDCAGTGKQKSLKDYFDRGGAMGLRFATERMSQQ